LSQPKDLPDFLSQWYHYWVPFRWNEIWNSAHKVPASHPLTRPASDCNISPLHCQCHHFYLVDYGLGYLRNCGSNGLLDIKKKSTKYIKQVANVVRIKTKISTNRGKQCESHLSFQVAVQGFSTQWKFFQSHSWHTVHLNLLHSIVYFVLC
jgi:hypothetical protein